MKHLNSWVLRGLLVLTLALALGFAWTQIGFAGSMNFRAHLHGGEEVPPVDTNAQGQVILRAAKDGASVHFKLIVANIEDVGVAHIHCGVEGVNGPAVVFLYGPGPVVSPDGVLAQGTFTATNVSAAADSAACPGGIAAGSLTDLIDQIEAGNAYVNVHTLAYPGGEIRGQLH